MKAYHWLRNDMTAESGGEAPWKVGETREITGKLELCWRGYHSSPTPWDGLPYARGSRLCLVDVSPPVEKNNTPNARKQVSRRRTLIAVADVTRELRLFASDCLERVLRRERKAGREPDERLWRMAEVARRYANGEATDDELAAARAVALDASADAVSPAATAVARAAAWVAAWDAARAAASAEMDAELRWQRRRFNALMLACLKTVDKERIRKA